jgi:hypothetical protein
MKTSILISMILIVLGGCRRSAEVMEYSNLRIEGENRNDLIISRIPEYGLGQNEGCIVHPQISMDIEVLNEKLLRGIITDANTKEPRQFASIVLFFGDKSPRAEMRTDSFGQFEYELKIPISTIKVDYGIYRTLRAYI